VLLANVNFVYFATPLLESKRVCHHQLRVRHPSTYFLPFNILLDICSWKWNKYW